MSVEWFEDDDVLLEVLRQTLITNPGDHSEALLMTGYDLVMNDDLAAELAYDSLSSSAAPIRSGSGETVLRTMAFSIDELEIEIEIGQGRLTGSISPPQHAAIVLEQLTQRTLIDCDEFGTFETELESSAAIRLRVTTVDDRTFVTPWIGVAVEGRNSDEP